MAGDEQLAITESGTEVARRDDDALLIPYSGELVPVDDPDRCAHALAEIRNLEKQLREVKSELTFHLVQEFKRQGSKTMHFDSFTAELKGGSDIAWDLEVLEQLRDLGLPEERWNELVTAEITYKVSTLEAKRIAAANPEYAAVIERAQQRYDKTPYVTIKT